MYMTPMLNKSDAEQLILHVGQIQSLIYRLNSEIYIQASSSSYAALSALNIDSVHISVALTRSLLFTRSCTRGYSK